VGFREAPRSRNAPPSLPALFLVSPALMVSSGKSAMSTTPPTSQLFRHVMGNFVTGITVITAECEPGKVHGMTASSLTSVSLDPLLILVCIDHNARLLSFLTSQRRFGVNILREQQRLLSEHFAKAQQDPETDARMGIEFRWTPTGIPLLKDALAHLACNVAAQYVAGDHTIFVGEVESLDLDEGEPLLYHRGKYRRIQP